jgi:hypothetical protein
MRKFLTLLAALTVIFATGQAKAQDIIDTTHWSFTGTDAGITVHGSGTFTTEEFLSGTIAVTAATGTIYDSQVGGGPFVINGLSLYAGADNLLYDSTNPVDFGGISFTTVGGPNFNIGGGGDAEPGDLYGYVLNDSYNNPEGYAWSPIIGSVNIDFSTCDLDDPDHNQGGGCRAVLPEPSSAPLMAVGLLAVGAVISRRRRPA